MLTALAARGQASQGWHTHQDPTGFSVSLPPRWEIRADRASGRIDIQGAPREQVIIWPVFILTSTPRTQRVMNAQIQRLAFRAAGSSFDEGTAAAVLHRLTARLWPDAVWEAQEPAGAVALRQRGRVGDRHAVAILTWFTSPKGTAAYLYATAAPESRFQNLEQTFAQILRSFRVAGAPVQPQEPGLRYVRWRDPRENAFSLDVPSGWQISGGLFRFASVDTRSAVETVSPDGQIRILFGDAEVPPFTEPNPTLQMAGFREGTWYSPGYGVQMFVRRYAAGRAFALEQARNKLARGCSELSPTETRDRPDAVEAMNTIYARFGQLGMLVRLTAGEVAFTCHRGGQPMMGYYFAATQITAGQGFGLWHAPHLFGYIATPEKVGQAQAVAQHMLSSVEVNPQWAAMQSHLTGETSRIANQTNQEISNLMNDTYWRRQGVMDELARRRSNATLGVEDVIDPTTGRECKIESGSNYYWIDQRGTIVGTETGTRPNLDFRELIRLP